MAAIAVVGIAACGDDEPERQKNVSLDLVQARFAERQRVAHEETMELAIRNPSDRAVEQITITLRPEGDGMTGAGFSASIGGAGASDTSRPVWILDKAPFNSVTADPAVFRGGPIGPGRTARFRWQVQPVAVGEHRLHWVVGGDLRGRTRVIDAQGDPLEGTFTVTIGR